MSVATTKPQAIASPARDAEATRAWIVAGLLGAAFVALYFRWFRMQGEFSIDKPDDWGHAFLIPVISGAMLWRLRDRIATLEARPFWPGVLPLVLGVMCYLFFMLGVSNHMLQGFSMILCMAGVTLLVMGLETFRIAFLPLAYLLCGITISEQIMNAVTFQLQLLATKGGWLLLHLISLPGNWFFVESAGNTLEVQHNGRSIPLNVAEACSGMRMVIAFIALAAAVGIFTCKHWWQRIAVVMLAVPVSILMNVVRVAVLALASIGDVDLAAGNAHMIIGTVLLIPGMGLFLLSVWALKRIVVDPEDEAAAKAARPPAKAPAKAHAKSTASVAASPKSSPTGGNS